MAKARVSEASYFNAINVTPFIDVLLVLLIVIILSLPVAMHKVPVDLPNGVPKAGPEEPHRLSIDKNGALYFDGRAISDAALPRTLAAMHERPNAVLQMQTDPDAQYARFSSVLTEVKRAGITRLGFIGHQRLPD